MTTSPLLTDLYQLTMAAGYWKCGKAEQEAVFHLFFRKLPFSGGCAVAAGLRDVGGMAEKLSLQHRRTGLSRHAAGTGWQAAV